MTTAPERLAWELIRGGLSRAVIDLLSELTPSQQPYKGDQEHLDRRIEAEIGHNELQIDREFSANPAALPLLSAVKPVFANWLRFCNLDELEADAFAKRLSSYPATLPSGYTKNGASVRGVTNRCLRL